jgi:serine protease Do
MTKWRVLIAAAGCWCAVAHSAPFDQAYWIAVASAIVKVEVARPGGYSLGTGVVVAPGRVATACHVLRGGSQVAVLYAGIRRNVLTRSTPSADHDVCVLQVPQLEARPAEVRPTANLAIGEEIGAIGFSAGAGVHYARGAVARLHHFQDGVVVQGSAAFTSGASGGGLFDADKRLVGILMFRMRGAGPQYFSVPNSWFAAALPDVAAREDAGADVTDEPFWNRAPDRLPYFMRANMLMTEQRWDDLAALLGRWRVDEPTSGEPAFLQAEVDSRHERNAQALVEYKEAVERDPAHALAWSGLVRACMRTHDLDLARHAYGRLSTLSTALSRQVAAEFPEVLQ